jgi:hypothetical protein
MSRQNNTTTGTMNNIDDICKPFSVVDEVDFSNDVDDDVVNGNAVVAVLGVS